ncbi:hypothetical protein AB0N24_06700 [Arthrobacter sp. NPDC093128]|uniref:hypothetical protein n=1 Tax=Arthrobacter sp. NPDC093128 TaxID=3154979 RepID=UPI00341F0A78
MGTVDDSLAALAEPQRGCLQRVIDNCQGRCDAVASQLDGYSLSKGTIRFTPDHPVPDDVLEEIVRLRRAEILK